MSALMQLLASCVQLDQSSAHLDREAKGRSSGKQKMRTNWKDQSLDVASRLHQTQTCAILT